MIERSFEFYSDVQGDGPTANRITVTIEIKANYDNEVEWEIQSIYDKTSQCDRELDSFGDEISKIESWCEELAWDSYPDAYSCLVEAAMDRLED